MGRCRSRVWELSRRALHFTLRPRSFTNDKSIKALTPYQGSFTNDDTPKLRSNLSFHVSHLLFFGGIASFTLSIFELNDCTLFFCCFTLSIFELHDSLILS